MTTEAHAYVAHPDFGSTLDYFYDLDLENWPAAARDAATEAEVDPDTVEITLTTNEAIRAAVAAWGEPETDPVINGHPSPYLVRWWHGPTAPRVRVFAGRFDYDDATAANG